MMTHPHIYTQTHTQGENTSHAVAAGNKDTLLSSPCRCVEFSSILLYVR